MIRMHLIDTLNRIGRDSEMTQGMARYCMDIVSKYKLEGVDISVFEGGGWGKSLLASCPITLEAMHFPVLASDGNSYELDAIMKHITSSSSTSPLTREEMRPFYYFNASLYRTEASLFRMGGRNATRRRRRQTEGE
jgi:hypothetical protein